MLWDNTIRGTVYIVEDCSVSLFSVQEEGGGKGGDERGEEFFFLNQGGTIIGKGGHFLVTRAGAEK